MLLVSAALSIVPTQPIAHLESLENRSQEGEQHVYIIRHGQSTSNVPDPATKILLTSGKSLKISLTEKGMEQASHLGKALLPKIKEGSPVVICSSTALRAQQTAQQIFEVLKEKVVCELGQGKWEGLPKDEKYESLLKKWKKLSPYDKVIVPKMSTGESHRDVTTRCLPDLQTIADKHAGKVILVVSHYSAINAMALEVNQFELSKQQGSDLPIIDLENCDLIAMTVSTNGSKRVFTHISSGLGDE